MVTNLVTILNWSLSSFTKRSVCFQRAICQKKVKARVCENLPLENDRHASEQMVGMEIVGIESIPAFGGHVQPRMGNYEAVNRWRTKWQLISHL